MKYDVVCRRCGVITSHEIDRVVIRVNTACPVRITGICQVCLKTQVDRISINRYCEIISE